MLLLTRSYDTAFPPSYFSLLSSCSSGCTLLLKVLFMALTTAHPATGFWLVDNFAGPTFFEKWDFYSSWDNLTSSYVWWVNETQATAERLAYVDEAGHAIIRVDNTTDIAPAMTTVDDRVVDDARRDTIRITTKDYYDFGTLWVLDVNHMPYGCGVWPAFWTKGDIWPDYGEIDIMEAINLMPNNQMAIHTNPGCFMTTDVVQTGDIGSLNCTSASGCTVKENKVGSYGQAFSEAGGGVYAAQFDVQGVFIWFWSRADVPKNLADSTTTLDISSWGTPSASFPTGPQCNLTQYFKPQQVVINIALCGIWAGLDGVYKATGCDGTCHASGPGSPAFDNAYFDINYMRAYSTASPVPTPTSTSTTNTVPTTLTTAAPPTRTGSDSGGGVRKTDGSTGVVAVAVVVFSVLGMVLFS